MAHFPLWNLKPGDTKRSQIRPHIIGHDTEIFSYHTRGASFLQDNAEIFFALAFVRVAVFGCIIVAGNEMRRAAAGSCRSTPRR